MAESWWGRRRSARQDPAGRTSGPDSPQRCLLRSPLFDEAWYLLQAGRVLSREGAVDDYLRVGRHQGLTPHPLFDPGEFARARPTLIPPGEDPLVVYLRGRYFKAPVHPFLPMWEFLKQHPGCDEHPQGPIGHYLEHLAPRGISVNDWYRPSPDQPRGLVDWIHGRAQEISERRRELPGVDWTDVPLQVTDQTSVVITVHDDWHPVPDAVRAVREARTPSDPVELVVVDDGLPLAAAVVVSSLQDQDPHALVVAGRTPTGRAAAANVGLALTRGETIVLMDPGTVVQPGWLGPLRRALTGDVLAAQPVLVQPSGAIASAGPVFDNDGCRMPLLAGHPPEDASGAAGAPLQTLDDACVACRRVDLIELRGLGVGGVDDLTDRLARLRHGRLALVPESRVMVQGVSGGRDRPVDLGALLEAVAPLPRARIEEYAPRLRWAIKNPAPYFEADLWGDTHFARHLAAALRGLGQEVVLDHRDELERTIGHPEDVAVVLRGSRPVAPRPNRLDVMWLIYDPDEVTREELSAYDRIWVASVPFATTLAEDWQVPALPLLQATDPTVFHPGLAEPDTGAEVLFVGNSRHVQRPMVTWAIEAGLPVRVYGEFWHGLIPEQYVEARHLPNDRVGAAYRSAGVVLNDHWPQMRDKGFIANRIFDALAAGARVISDDVVGLAEVFGDAVPIAHDAEELGRIVRERPFLDEQGRLDLAAKVAAEHSFDVRARAMLDDAVTMWRRRADS